MANEDRWEYINQLDDQLLKGGVILSEWCALIVRETDIAFVGEAHLATVITAMAGIEAYLRSEYAEGSREPLYALIERAAIKEELRRDIHALRKFRNRWVHVADPHDDQPLIDDPTKYDRELEEMARAAVRTLRRAMYDNQLV